MQRAIGTRLGFTAFWKTDYFSKYFSNFASFFLCYCFLLRFWFRKLGLLIVFINFKERGAVLRVLVGIYRYGIKHRGPKKFGAIERKKIKKYRWKRAVSKDRTTRLNRGGLRPFSTLRLNKDLTNVKGTKVGNVRKKRQKLFVFSPLLRSIFGKYLYYSRRVLKRLKKKKLKSLPVRLKKKRGFQRGVHHKGYKKKKRAKQKKFKKKLSSTKKRVLKFLKGQKIGDFFRGFFVLKREKKFTKRFIARLNFYWKKKVRNLSKAFCKGLVHYYRLLWFERKKNAYKICQKAQHFWRSLTGLYPLANEINKKLFIGPFHYVKKKKKVIKGFSYFFQKIKKIKNIKNVKFFERPVNLELNLRIPLLRGMKKVFNWGRKKFKIFLSFFLEQNFYLNVDSMSIRYKFLNVFKPSKIPSCKLIKYRKLLYSKLFRVHSSILKKLKKKLFLKFFSLRNISFFILKQLSAQWGTNFRFFPQLADFINIVNISLFFTKAEFLSEIITKLVVQNKRNWLQLLRQSNRILQYFYPIFCARPVNYSVRIGIFGKLGGQRKRKFKTLFLTSGSGNPRQQFSVPLDYAFKGFWNYIGSFGVKVWVYRNNTL